MVNVRLATACLAAAAALLSLPSTTNAIPSPSVPASPSDHALLRRRAAAAAPFQGLEGEELIAWTENHRAALRSKYASKLKASAAQEAEALESRRRRRRRRAEDDDDSSLQVRATTGSADLTNYQFDSTFFAPVSIGAPGQTVNLVLDTGSSDMWTVQGKENWNPAASTSFVNSTTPFSITYGSGDVRGTLASDSVTLAGNTAAKQTFAIATSISDGLLGSAVEGIMGLGFPSLSTSRTTPFWQSVDAGEFSFYLAASAPTNAVDRAPGGTFTLGGRNTSLFQGDINWSSVIDETYWLITLGGITANGQTVDLSGMNKVAVDTGTTLIGAPDTVVKQLYAQVSNSQELSSGYYTFPCAQQSDLSATLHFGNQEYSLSSDNLIAGTTDTSGQTCLGSFFSIGSTAQDELQYILGDAFLMNVYSIFSAPSGSAAQVGFAALAEGLSATTASRTVSQVVAANGAAAAAAHRASSLGLTAAAIALSLWIAA